jgi:hypothetical protein
MSKIIEKANMTIEEIFTMEYAASHTGHESLMAFDTAKEMIELELKELRNRLI